MADRCPGIARPYPHGDTVCAGCHACQPERFPNTSAAYCGCSVCNPGGVFGPVEVVVNGVRYVREETLFAAMREVERLQSIAAAAADLVIERPFGSLSHRAFYRLREALRNVG